MTVIKCDGAPRELLLELEINVLHIRRNTAFDHLPHEESQDYDVTQT